MRWQKWSLRLGWDPYEGLVLHQVGYDDGGRTRSILHRASIAEMVVPYGDPGEAQGWKNASDAGEWGLGRMTQSLTLGCDCVGEIHYVDVTMATEQGTPWVVPNAICLHEEDYGIMSPQAIRPGEAHPYATLVAEGVVAPVHQHMFCARLDFDVDGIDNRIEEVEAEILPISADNPWVNGFRAKPTLLERESQAQREVNPATSRSWRVTNPKVHNGLGQPVGYKLIPTMATPTLLARPESSVARRAGFAQHNLWVTPFAAAERRAAGDFPNQHEGGDGLPAWTAADRPLVDTDVVLWYSFGVTHFPRPEDWPVMPVEYTGFLLSPYCFFDRNPALDVPPSPPSHCHGLNEHR